jgi:hypothetical protein
VLVELRPLVHVGLVGDEGLVAHGVEVGAGEGARQVLVVGEDDDVGGVVEPRQDRGDGADEHRVDEQDLVVGVVDDEDELVLEQARVDGVAHHPGPGDAVVQLEVAVVVPGQGADAVTHGQAAAFKGVGELPSPGEGLPVGVPVAGVVDGEGDDLLVAVQPVGVAGDLADEQRTVHHQAVHGAGGASGHHVLIVW